MNATKHLHNDSALTEGAQPPSDAGTTIWVSVILDGDDLTVFGTVDQLIEVGRLFLSQAIALRDDEARSLLAAAAS